ncbi:MAG TPA: acyl-CoA thioesterase II [Acidimicrobiia bacterium]|nr:acyl-CoA thioesterase II [Acidimicrobiia bacterium]
MGTALDDLIDLLELEQLEVNLFRGLSPDEDRQRVFGGQVAAQALTAAGRTVDPLRQVHSLHAYFLRPGDPTIPLIYEVDRIRDGKSFTTRRVVGIQHGKAIFNLAASFQIAETGPEHSDPMPDVPDPETLPTFRERIEPHLDRLGPDLGAWLVRERPIDSRPVTDPPWLDPTPRAPEQDVWIKTNGTLPDDPLLHTCVVAYASDLTLLDTAMLPHSVSHGGGQWQVASLDHAMWFHRPLRVDEWLLYHQTSPSAGNARGLAEGSIFRPDGMLAVTVIQEGLIRPIGQ